MSRIKLQYPGLKGRQGKFIAVYTMLLLYLYYDNCTLHDVFLSITLSPGIPLA